MIMALKLHQIREVLTDGWQQQVQDKQKMFHCTKHKKTIPQERNV